MIFLQFVESRSIEIFVAVIALGAHFPNEFIEFLIDVLKFNNIAEETIVDELRASQADLPECQGYLLVRIEVRRCFTIGWTLARAKLFDFREKNLNLERTSLSVPCEPTPRWKSNAPSSPMICYR